MTRYRRQEASRVDLEPEVKSSDLTGLAREREVVCMTRLPAELGLGRVSPAGVNAIRSPAHRSRQPVASQ